MNRLMGLIEEVMKTAKALECRVHMAYNGSDICFTFSKGLISSSISLNIFHEIESVVSTSGVTNKVIDVMYAVNMANLRVGGK